MDRADASSDLDEAARRRALEALGNCYHGVELAPRTLESLVAWDVSNHAQREQDRLHSTQVLSPAVRGGY
jgi:hypothetical protein